MIALDDLGRFTVCYNNIVPASPWHCPDPFQTHASGCISYAGVVNSLSHAVHVNGVDRLTQPRPLQVMVGLATTAGADKLYKEAD